MLAKLRGEGEFRVWAGGKCHGWPHLEITAFRRVCSFAEEARVLQLRILWQVVQFVDRHGRNVGLTKDRKPLGRGLVRCDAVGDLVEQIAILEAQGRRAKPLVLQDVRSPDDVEKAYPPVVIVRG